ncbi:MAG: dTMP kinase [Anaerolineae bacterium]|nr:dTMP kinase [Anaerolineae bacterium]NUQ05166.1 dTMP kinase [Anaerolineae bacterium]
MSGAGFFIVFEGLDGSGKSAVSAHLAELYSQRLGADRALHTYEPNNPSAAGTYIRDVLEKRIVISTRTLALAFALNRADHNERVIAPFLNGGAQRVVVCDRYLMSSLVYQSDAGLPGGGLSLEEVASFNAAARLPDLTLFLDATPETCYRRMGARGGERHLYEERLAETRAKYLRVIDWMQARSTRIASIDANDGFEAVIEGVLAALGRYAPPWAALM